MKNIVKLSPMIFLAFFISVSAADFDEVYSAYEKQKYDIALEGFLELANENHMESQYYLGTMYREGEGVDQDYSKSLEWYLKAANLGSKGAQHNVALFYPVSYTHLTLPTTVIV